MCSQLKALLFVPDLTRGVRGGAYKNKQTNKRSRVHTMKGMIKPKLLY